MKRTYPLSLIGLLCFSVWAVGAAAEHRAEVRQDWAFQHRYAVVTDKAGKVGLRNDQQPAPLVDEQAGTLKDDRDPTDQVARRTEALLAHLAKTFPGKADWAAFRKRIEPLSAEARAGAPDLTGEDAARQKTYTALCALRREVALANPLLDFDDVLFSEESNVGACLQRATTGQYNGLEHTEPGGALYLVRGWKGASPEVIDLCARATVENGPYRGQGLAGSMFHAPSELRRPDRLFLLGTTALLGVADNRDGGPGAGHPREEGRRPGPLPHWRGRQGSATTHLRRPAQRHRAVRTAGWPHRLHVHPARGL
jgi:hypothetical protein